MAATGVPSIVNKMFAQFIYTETDLLFTTSVLKNSCKAKTKHFTQYLVLFT